MATAKEHITPELLRKITAGDENAFRSLFDLYKNNLFDYLIGIVKSRQVAEELVMDIFLKLWLGREWIADIEHIEPFIKKVAYNKAIDFLRYAARNQKLQHIIAREMAGEVDRSLEMQLLEKDYQHIIQEAVRQLSPQRRLVYTMSREKGMTHDEIARELNLSIHTVSNHTKEALRSIRGFLSRNNVPVTAFLLYTLQK
ncbi:RNA polymerase sigma-70 factor [Flavitalea sp. BT771]|uniref:RNA polymerase sigma-70 factor n=1 Tax=Flavitalea sp. BT771 TaxID=3063329 RepID=UPI0026E3E51C|nr:RNA polymerase sigma-70 factor [Flavitalea sp. BT771]MDO6430075.1 RNA polymerase sigma-70 factor [Flavitalea sp. BT771]MDV6219786.1 RNA polymerase sigma-70 factor [Flavitalea sp. BT771]